MSRIVTIGEMLVRYQTADNSPLSQSSRLDAFYGGAEANTAVTLGYLGHDVHYVTALPHEHPLTKAMKKHLRQAGVHTDMIYAAEGRIGTYYLEKPVSVKQAEVYYDRSGASVLGLPELPINWEELFSEKDWLHVTGITSALSPELRSFVKEALQQARHYGVKTSFDFNFRGKLWTPEEAAEAFRDVLPLVDHCFAGWKDFAWLFNWEKQGSSYEEELTHFYQRLHHEFGVASAASTKRELLEDGSHRLTGYYFDGESLTAGLPASFKPLDRVGGGDAFASGVLHGTMTNMPGDELLAFSIACSTLTHLVQGDQGDYEVHDILRFMQNQRQDVSR
ncbi:sugar kinase [Alkalicoccus luteus]|uniref:sugar kinase n=1 Tax=Alkalicoccus luteus TaxID=1237094 RepID=UPI004033FFA8